MSKNALIKIIKATTWGPRHNILPSVVALRGLISYLIQVALYDILYM